MFSLYVDETKLSTSFDITEYGQLLPQDLTRHSVDPPPVNTIPPFLLTFILCPAKAQFSQHRGIEPTTHDLRVIT